MTHHLSNVRFLRSGWCSQFARLAGVRSWRWIRFDAVFVYFEHPVHGGCLIDTGYSDDFFRATRWFPQRMHRWITPVCLDEQRNARDRLQSAGIDPATVRHLFISHFHADHIAGLNCFPEVQYIHRGQVCDRLQQQSASKQVRHGFLAEFIPGDFGERSQIIREDQFTQGEGDWSEFQVLDYWGDGSLILVDLPGHADGHYGFVLQTQEQRLFYIVDACWHVQVMLDRSPLPWISRRFQHDESAYFATQDKLRRLTERTGIELLACHCPRTTAHVT
jgi:glyoxylase-like metal-dependent hydrolase (beta-lactamase superfamily II)